MTKLGMGFSTQIGNYEHKKTIFDFYKKKNHTINMPRYKFYKENPKDVIWRVDNPEQKGVWLFSFDKKKVFNMFRDYPTELTKEQKEIFDKESPYWVDFFKDREDIKNPKPNI